MCAQDEDVNNRRWERVTRVEYLGCCVRCYRCQKVIEYVTERAIYDEGNERRAGFGVTSFPLHCTCPACGASETYPVAHDGNGRHVVTRVVEDREPVALQDIHITDCPKTDA